MAQRQFDEEIRILKGEIVARRKAMHVERGKPWDLLSPSINDLDDLVVYAQKEVERILFEHGGTISAEHKAILLDLVDHIQKERERILSLRNNDAN